MGKKVDLFDLYEKEIRAGLLPDEPIGSDEDKLFEIDDTKKSDEKPSIFTLEDKDNFIKEIANSVATMLKQETVS